MRQRVLLLLVVSLVLAAPLAVEAQQTGKVYRIGFLGNTNPKHLAPSLDGFRQGLREHGWIEGQNVSIEYRWADGDLDRQPALVADLVTLPPDVLVVAGTTAVRAARQASRTIPIVGAIMSDPVHLGFVESFARPGGNITGLANQFEDVIPKQLQILREATPNATRVAILFHTLVSPALRQAAEAAARALGLTARVLEIRGEADLEGAFRAAKTEQANAIHVLPSPFLNRHRARLAELAAKHRLPAIYEVKEYVDAGGFMSYGPSFPDMYRRAASYVDRILRGARPGDLPVEQPTKFELAINLKTAKALGMTIPPSLLLRADQVIE